MRRSLIPAVLLTSVTLTGVAAGSAQAADLRLPFACGAQFTGKTYSGHSPQNAIDYNGLGGGDSDLGMKIVAAGSGTVTKSLYYSKASNVGYGNAIEIRHGDGTRTFYAHLRDRKVKVGDKVSRGQLIGHLGNSSAKYNLLAHLHYEQRSSSGAVVKAQFNGRTAPEYARFGSAVSHKSDNCPKSTPGPSTPTPTPTPNPTPAPPSGGGIGVALPSISTRFRATVRTDNGLPVSARKDARTSAAVVRKFKNGDAVRIVCQKRGQTVTGKYGTSNLWDLVDLGGGRGAYITDTYVYTGRDGRVAPACP
ncbi:peptidoglycan DD-metalloendopeptidase family protein [Conexibacter sp. W3-3-2]|uniref:peptidoglycan DD-metalloendopeptidase family protein n=1 Tax=Conexibacter sp. W3-3-2 TaxID=2675227 RepID=UPI0012B8E5DC|nr:peptidoglycan DD-metalloendopeptidase family protein [Conexibacter sp. W3-3-2]MTD45550.1 peptidoglycan DD-metalloendopeptidase family protein [Conexibacter sp. W3-3-2]